MGQLGLEQHGDQLLCSVRRISHMSSHVSFLPTMLDAHQIKTFPSCTVSQFRANKTSSSLLSQGNPVPWVTTQNVLQEEPWVPQLCPKVFVFGWVTILSTLVGTLSLVTSAIWELPTCALECKRRPGRLDTNLAAAICEADALCHANTVRHESCEMNGPPILPLLVEPLPP